MATAKITSKGQVTIPRRIREHLRVGEGDRLEFRVDEEGAVRLVSVGRPARDLYGMLHRPDTRPVSVEEMNVAIAAGRQDADRRSRIPRRKTS
jgi:antitoxin PrlF